MICSDKFYVYPGAGSRWQVFGEIERQLNADSNWVKNPNNAFNFHLLLADRGRFKPGVLARQSKYVYIPLSLSFSFSLASFSLSFYQG